MNNADCLCLTKMHENVRANIMEKAYSRLNKKQRWLARTLKYSSFRYRRTVFFRDRFEQ